MDLARMGGKEENIFWFSFTKKLNKNQPMTAYQYFYYKKKHIQGNHNFTIYRVCDIFRKNNDEILFIFPENTTFYPGNSTCLIAIVFGNLYAPPLLLYSCASPVQLLDNSGTYKGHRQVNFRDRYRTACALYDS